MTLPTHALSIRQPWAWAIIHAGKDVENRDWRPSNPGLKFRGPVMIHASKGMTRDEYEGCLHACHQISYTHPFPPGLAMPAFDDLLRGGIVGTAKIVDVVTKSDSPWFFGPCGLILEDVRPIPFIPCKGALGFFKPELPA